MSSMWSAHLQSIHISKGAPLSSLKKEYNLIVSFRQESGNSLVLLEKFRLQEVTSIMLAHFIRILIEELGKAWAITQNNVFER